MKKLFILMLVSSFAVISCGKKDEKTKTTSQEWIEAKGVSAKDEIVDCSSYSCTIKVVTRLI